MSITGRDPRPSYNEQWMLGAIEWNSLHSEPSTWTQLIYIPTNAASAKAAHLDSDQSFAIEVCDGSGMFFSGQLGGSLRSSNCYGNVGLELV